MASREGAWRDFFEVAPGSFVVVDRDGKILDVSPPLLAALGCARDAVALRDLRDVLHPRDPGGALADGESVRCLSHVSGSERWFAVATRAVDDVVYGILTPRDPPAPGGSLAAWLTPSQQLAAVLEHAPIVVFAVDRDGVFALSRGHGLRALALSPDEVTGKSLFELYAGTPVVDQVRRALAGDAFSAEVESGGRRFDTHFAPLRDTQGDVLGAMGIAIDITDHHRAEERFRRLIERMPDGVAVVREGRIVYANPTLVADLGRGSAGEILGLPLAELLVDGDPSTLARVEAAAVSLERLPPEEGRFRTRGGGTLTAEVALMPLGDPGAPATLLVARNVTDRKAMQTRLILAERLVSLGTLAAGVAHEINNPLTYVSLNLGFMTRELAALAKELGATRAEEPPRSLDEQRLDLRARVERTTEALRVTKEGVERVATIVRDLRTFSRADEGDRGPIDVRRVLEAAISIAWNEIRHRARLAKEYGDTLPVVANEARLAQVFVHLLLNAAHALPEGDAARHEIRVVASTDDKGRVVIEVRDTGAGIPAEIIDRIFDPFFTTKPVGVGTGLGLSVCHGIVGSLGGEITAHSRNGAGTTFRVSLPAYVPSPAVADDRTSLAPASPRSARPRVLLIDDEPFVVSALRRTLEAEADVVAVESGRDAIDILLRDQRFDVILCDLMMPDIGGMDVYEAVRRARPGVEKNFVLMTGGAFTHRARDFVAAVPNRCLDKPIDPEEIRRLVMESRGRK